MLDPLLDNMFDLLELAGRGIAALAGARPPGSRLKYGCLLRARHRVELRGSDLRIDGEAMSFRVHLPIGTVVRVTRESEPAGADLGVCLVGGEACIPPQHIVHVRAHGYLLQLPLHLIASKFDALPPAP